MKPFTTKEDKISQTGDIKTKISKRIFAAEDARQIARRRLPRLIFDFIDGATGREIAARRNELRFDELMLQPRVMGDIENRTLSTTLLGKEYGLPFGIAPMGMCNLSCPNADRIIANTAKSFNIPVGLSSSASSSIEDMHAWAGQNAWFQLYVAHSIEQSLALVERARNCGYGTLVLTVDVPQVSRRVRDLKNGFQVPFSIGPKQFFDFARHPAWSLSTLLHGIPSPQNFQTSDGGNQYDRNATRSGANWEFLERLRDLWKGRLIVKGITSTKDARRAKTCGVDAVYVSNHGGRQLDSAPAAIDLLPKVRAEVGSDYPLIFDGGVRNGEDIIKSLALGADFVMLGRPILFALAAEAEVGLNSLIRILADDVSVAMAQLGARTISEVTADVMFSTQDTAEQEVKPSIHLASRSA